MKTKIITLFLALITSIGTLYAYHSFNFMAKVGDFYYGFLRSDQTAMVMWPNQTNPDPNRYVGDIVVPATVTYNDTTYTVIEIEDAFRGCTNLTSVTIPNTVTCIDGAFEKCTKLKSVNIPPDITFIGVVTFSECSSLKSITIPEKVKYIGQKAFYKCDSLEIIMLPSTPPAIRRYNYPYSWMIPLTIPIYVPCGSMDAYMATDWANYNLQEMHTSFKVNILSSDSLIGNVTSEWVSNNECNPILSITATPMLGSRFIQWSDGITDNPRIITLTQDTTITAIFATQTFIVTFVDDNDTILSSQEYEYGAIPVPPTNPVKTDNAQYFYTFAGWTPQIVPVTSDATYKATYTATEKTETIIDNVIGDVGVPTKYIENGSIYIIMPNGKKYSIIGELIN